MLTHSSTGINLQGFTKLKWTTTPFANRHSKSKNALIDILPPTLEELDVRAIRFREPSFAEMVALGQQKYVAFPVLRNVADYGAIESVERAILEHACKKSVVRLRFNKGSYSSEEWRMDLV